MDLRTLIATNRVLNASDLSYNEVLVLGYVGENPYAVVGSVGEAVGLLPAGISRTVNTLEHQGLIERTLDRVDRRKLRLNLTAVGTKLYHELQQELEAL